MRQWHDAPWPTPMVWLHSHHRCSRRPATRNGRAPPVVGSHRICVAKSTAKFAPRPVAPGSSRRAVTGGSFTRLQVALRGLCTRRRGRRCKGLGECDAPQLAAVVLLRCALTVSARTHASLCGGMSTEVNAHPWQRQRRACAAELACRRPYIDSKRIQCEAIDCHPELDVHLGPARRWVDALC